MTLSVSIGQFSDKGRKPANQDFFGALIPAAPSLHVKGLVVAVADGISSSAVSAVAAETAIRSFLTDYYSAPDSWPVRMAAQRVIAATNSWLHAQSQRGAHPDDPDRGFVCTLSALVLKAGAAHVFHVGDSRVARLVGRSLEPLTNDHRVAGPERSYLARAMGVGPNIEIDYASHNVAAGDVFVLTTDGVHDFVDGAMMAAAIAEHAGDLDAAARAIAGQALERGSGDNLTIQIVRVETVPLGELADHLAQDGDLPLLGRLEAGQRIDGLRVVRQLHGNARSSVYLVEDEADGRLLALKAPSPEMADDRVQMQRFAMEEWIARRVQSPHVLRAAEPAGRCSANYLLTDYVEGQTLGEWMRANPRPSLGAVRDVVGQIGKGLTAMHRLAIVHQDLRPDNVIIDAKGVVQIIDFGSARVAGIAELETETGDWPGTLQYTAPECLLGAEGSVRSDLFSLAVIAYQLLAGRLPYDADAARVKRPADVAALRLLPIEAERNVPAWMEAALARALNIDARRRHEEVAEFVYDLHHARSESKAEARDQRPLADQLVFWKSTALVLGCAVAVLAFLLMAL